MNLIAAMLDPVAVVVLDDQRDVVEMLGEVAEPAVGGREVSLLRNVAGLRCGAGGAVLLGRAPCGHCQHDHDS